MEVNRKPVRGTCRQRVVIASGLELERSFVYLDRATWHALRRLAAKQRTSGSIVIAQLINLAASYNGDMPSVTE